MFLSYNNKNLKRLCMHRILLLLFFSLFVLYANENTQRKYNQTIVLVTHDARMASYADCILRIEDGQIVGERNEK